MHGAPLGRIDRRATVLGAAGLGLLIGAAVQLQEAALWADRLGPVLAQGLCLGAVLAGVAMMGLAWTGGFPRGVVPQGARRAAPAMTVRRAGAVAFVGTLLLSWGLAEWRATARLAETLAASLAGQDLELVGRVEGLAVRHTDGSRFTVAVEQAWHEGRALRVPGEVPRRVSLGWYRGLHEGLWQAAALEAPRSGERWQFRVRLRTVHGLANPHGFDQELWMFEQGLRATGSVRATRPEAARRLQSGDAWGFSALRQSVRDRLDAFVVSFDMEAGATTRAARDPVFAQAGVVAALAIGDQSAIGREDWERFRVTGVAHLMSISGLHVTMFAWLATAMVRRAWRCSARACLRWPAARAGWVGGVCLAAAYAGVAGWGVPAQRTVGMLAVVTLLRVAGARWPWPGVLLAAASAVVVGDPWALLQPGFWLSFVAVGLLMVQGPGDAGQPVAGHEVAAAWPMVASAAHGDVRARCGPAFAAALRGAAARIARAAHAGLRTQVVATIGLAPMGVLFFQQVSVVGLLANLVAIPLVTLLITPLALLGCLWPALWPLAFSLVGLLTTVLDALAAWPVAQWAVPVAPWPVSLGGMVGAALCVMPGPPAWRLFGVPLLVSLLAWPGERPLPGRFELTVVDIGQGNAVLVRTARHTLLYDSGPAWGRDSDAGSRVLLPLMRALGERRLDRLVLSHRDLDHTGGASALLAALPVGEVLSSLETGHPLLRQVGARHAPCVAGTGWTWDGVRFDLLHPQAATLAAQGGQAVARPNGLSCVLRIGPAAAAGTSLAPARESAQAGKSRNPREAGGIGTALLAGDIERPEELALIDREATALDVDVLLVPHHGSRTSSTLPFLEAVDPVLALVQAGAANRFGHPAPDVVQRYRDLGIHIVRTDQCGAWRWNGAKMDRQAVLDATTWCERVQRQRYWHAAPMTELGP